MSSQQQSLTHHSIASSSQSQSQSQSLSFHHISKYFSLPLNDAASALGASSSDLKKICRENGLDRWPYRKFLSGKTIEEIKRYAAKERSKELLVLAKRAARQRISQSQEHETTKAQGVATNLNLQQEASKNVQVGRPHTSTNTGLTKGITTDEFKYGFPSDGLSTAANKWWGSGSTDGHEAISEDGAEIDEDSKHQSEGKADENATLAELDEDKSENRKLKSNIDLQGTGLLTAARKRGVEEWREALKLRVYSYGIRKLERRQSSLLLQIFRSPLPKEWISDCP